ncbi:MAG: ArnT family glycosyltransferase [Planctomycetota bacterium]
MPEYLDQRGRKTRYRLAVAVVMTAAFALRLMGLYRGYPYPMVWEETYNLGVVDLMVHSFSWVPVGQNLPALELYVQAVVLGVFGVWKLLWGEVGSLEAIHPLPGFGYSHPEVILWGRLISVFFGTLSVYMTYLLARRFYGRRASLMSAGVMALAVLPIRHSALMTGDALGVFLIVVTLIQVTRLQGKRSLRRYLITGLLLGLAVSANLSAIWLLAPMVWAHLNRKGLLRPKWGAFAGALVLGAAIFLLFNPQLLVNPGQAGPELQTRLAGLVSPPTGRSLELAFWQRLGLMVFGFGGPVVAMLAMVGLVLVVRRLGLSVMVPALYFVPALVVYLVASDFRVTRLLPLFPLWSLAAGLGLSWFVCRVMPLKDWLKQQGILEIAVLLVTWIGLWLVHARLSRLELPDEAGHIELFHLAMLAMLLAIAWQAVVMWGADKRRVRNLTSYPGLLLMAAAVALAVYMAVRLGLDPRYGWSFRLVYLACALGAVVLVMLQKQAGRDWHRWVLVVGMVLLAVTFNILWISVDLSRRDRHADTRLQAARWINRNMPESCVVVSDDLVFYLPTLECDEAGRVASIEQTPGSLVAQGWQAMLVGYPGDPLSVHLRLIRSWGDASSNPGGPPPLIRAELDRRTRAEMRRMIVDYQSPMVRLLELKDLGWTAVPLDTFHRGGQTLEVNPDVGGAMLVPGSTVSMPMGASDDARRLAVVARLPDAGQPARIVVQLDGKPVGHGTIEGRHDEMVQVVLKPHDKPGVLSIEVVAGGSPVVLRKVLVRPMPVGS